MRKPAVYDTFRVPWDESTRVHTKKHTDGCYETLKREDRSTPQQLRSSRQASVESESTYKTLPGEEVYETAATKQPEGTL